MLTFSILAPILVKSVSKKTTRRTSETNSSVATGRSFSILNSSRNGYSLSSSAMRTVCFYHNGRKVAEVKPGGELLEPMYMFLDTEVFIWEGLPAVEPLKDADTNTMYVDWVRAWKLEKRKGE